MSGRGEAGPSLGPGPEFDLIRRLVAGRSPGAGVVVGPGDDGAVLDDGLVLTCDMALEGVHFRREWLEPAAIGYRAATAALSDLAAMAAYPLGVLVSYGLPTEEDLAIAPEIHAGVDEACRTVGAEVVGGDVTRSSGPLVLDVLAVGRAERPVLRGGARPGDELWVTGRLGGAAAAVALLEEGREVPPRLFEPFARPRARVSEALWLAERVALRALIDLSDGLAGDAAHLAAASDVTVVVEAASIPVGEGVVEALRDEARSLDAALSGGEDYELLLACPPGALDRPSAAFEDAFGAALTRVGRVVARGEHSVLVEGPGGVSSPPARGGFDHFGGERQAGGEEAP